MTEDEQFDICDAQPGNTMLIFADEAIAFRYIARRKHLMPDLHGIIAKVDDTRTRSGLCVIWRDPIPADQLNKRHAECRWMIEEILAGHQPWPVPGEVHGLGIFPLSSD